MRSAGSPPAHLLIVGSGSVGKRHARNLSEMGAAISVVDPRRDRREELGRETAVTDGFDSLEAALAVGDYHGVVIASPTAFHVDQAAIAVARDLPVLLEKPVATNLRAAQELQVAVEAARATPMLGYTWRWWPALQRVRQLVSTGSIGAVRHVRCVLSAHLADWHPWEPYQDFFMSSQELGGGALLDESHWIDLACWLFGTPDEVFARIERLSALEIDTDDNVDLWLGYRDGPRVWLHLDIHGRPHERSLTIAGERGTIRWSDAPNEVSVGTGVGDWQQEPFRGERNDMFMAVAEEFLEVVNGSKAPSCGIADGIEVMRVIEAARRSQELGRVISLVAP